MRMRILCFMVGGLACLSVSAAEEKWWYSYDAIKIGIMDVASDRERLYGVQLCLCDFGDALRPIEAKKWYRHQVDGCVISLAHSIERCRGVSLGAYKYDGRGIWTFYRVVTRIVSPHRSPDWRIELVLAWT